MKRVSSRRKRSTKKALALCEQDQASAELCYKDIVTKAAAKVLDTAEARLRDIIEKLKVGLEVI